MRIFNQDWRDVFTNRGGLIDKGSIYIVVILTFLIFGGYSLIGGIVPTQIPTPNTNTVDIVNMPVIPTQKGLQLFNFSGVTPTAGAKKTPSDLPPVSLFEPVVVQCGRTFKGSQEHQMVWAIAHDSSRASGGVQAIKVFYTNKNAFVLGQGGVAAMANHPADTKQDPAVGDLAARDQNNFSIFPALYITDITVDPEAVSGDAQDRGEPNKPSYIYGAWKASGATDPAANGKVLGANADPWPATNVPGGVRDSTFTAEIIWKISDLLGYDPQLGQVAPLVLGHQYRIQAVLHDGGSPSDVGVACFTLRMPTATDPPPPPPPPLDETP